MMDDMHLFRSGVPSIWLSVQVARPVSHLTLVHHPAHAFNEGAAEHADLRQQFGKIRGAGSVRPQLTLVLAMTS